MKKTTTIIIVMLALIGCSPAPQLQPPPVPVPAGSSILIETQDGKEGFFVKMVDVNTGAIYGWQGSNPIWSTDGTQIAYYGTAHDDEANLDYGTIIEATTTGSEIRRLFHDFPSGAGTLEGFVQEIIWYRDNNYYFYTWASGEQGVHYYRYGQDGLKEVTPSMDKELAVSPDGTQVVHNVIGKTVLLDENGASLQQFDFSCSDFTWSPDGKTIACAAYSNTSKDDIITFDSTSGATTPLTNTPEVVEGDPAWSPNGELIAYLIKNASYDGLGNALWVMQADGSNPRLLAESPISVGPFSWSPDGKQIAYCKYDSSKNGTPEAYTLTILSIADSTTRTLVPFSNCRSLMWQP